MVIKELTPLADSPALNTMQDPAAKQPDELKAEQATELESASQDQAMDAEEGAEAAEAEG